MTLERLGDFLGSSRNARALQRIYLAYKLEQLIHEKCEERVRVVARERQFVVYCKDQYQAHFLRPQLTELAKTLPGSPKISVQIKSS